MAENEEALQDYLADILTLTDDDGVEHSFELLDILEKDGRKFMAMIPYHEDISESLEDDGELIIFEAVMEDEEEVLISIDDEELLGNVFSEFAERLSDYYEFEE